MSQTKERKVVGKSIIIVLGIACMILVASLVGAFAYYVPLVNSKNSAISSLNSQVANLQNQTASDNLTMVGLQNQIDFLQSQLTDLEKNASSDNATIANLQSQLSLLLNWSSYIEGLIIEGIIMNDPSAWVNRTAVVEGNLTGPLVFIPEGAPPWNYELNSNGTTIGVLWKQGDVYDSANVRVSGVVRQGRRAGGDIPPEIVYYVEAERIDML